MRLSYAAFAAAGYVLGARAGRERYESIVRVARRVTGSQTVQATAGVMSANLDAHVQRARDAVAARITGQPIANRTSKLPPAAQQVSR